MTTITSLPTAPDPDADDVVVFSAKATAFTKALNAFGTETNAVATEVNTASAAAVNAQNVAVNAQSAAVAAANYKGDWNSATAYTTGQSVSYLGFVYVAKVNSTNVLPTNTTTWLVVPSAAMAAYNMILFGVI